MSDLETRTTPRGVRRRAPGAGAPVIDLRDTALPLLVDLGAAAATEVALAGGKAAALAAASAELDVLPGVVLTTAFTEAIDAGAAIDTHPAVRAAFLAAGGDDQPLVARSSSVVEDTEASSMAGQFDSVIGIDGFEHFVAAVETVLGSRVRAGATGHGMAVLVQPLLRPVTGGVLFGVDPVSGRSDRRVVAVVHGGPEPLVSGEVDGSRYELDATGRVVHEELDGDAVLHRADLRRLAELATRVERTFGGPQDVEWAIDGTDRLWLLQSRPVTTEVRGVPTGPVYGPGPVAETFPEPLAEIEADLWVPPLRDAFAEALVLAGAATRKQLAASSLVVLVDGRVAIDLRLAGELRTRPRLAQRLNPVPAARRLRVAWRVGRLRAALPGLAEHVLRRVDRDLEAVPALDDLTDRQLVVLLRRTGEVLRALHAHEMLLGMLTDTGGSRVTGAAVALRVLAGARQDGLDEDDIVSRFPVVLALAPPKVGPRPILPTEVVVPREAPGGGDGTVSGTDSGTDSGVLREALRLRIRWVQELSGRAAWALGARLAEARLLPEADTVHHLRVADSRRWSPSAPVPCSLPADHANRRRRTLAGPLPVERPRTARAVHRRRRAQRRYRRRRRDRPRSGHL